MIDKKIKNRLIYLLGQSIECCGTIDKSKNPCPSCCKRIQKCSKLVKFWKVSFVEYLKLIQKVYKEIPKNKSSYDHDSDQELYDV